jgi:hypothetical protein
VTTELHTRPEWVRRLIACGDAAGGSEHLVPFDVDEMCESAAASTGLDDFGDVDGDWLGRLRSLAAAMDSNARMHAPGRFVTRTEFLRCLRTRLWLAEDSRRRPGVVDEVITAPLVVTGPARSGTTLLLELLDLDPSLRGARGWEIGHPGPASERDEADAVRLAETEYELWTDLHPEFRTVHDMRAAYPQECIHLQMPSFSGAYWPVVANIPGWTPTSSPPCNSTSGCCSRCSTRQPTEPGCSRPPSTWPSCNSSSRSIPTPGWCTRTATP